MSNLDKLLLPDEKVLFHTRKSLIIFLGSVFWTGLTVLAYFWQIPFLNGLDIPWVGSLNLFALVPGVIALWSWLSQGLLYLTSDYWVTSQRVIMREGLITRRAVETRLAAVAEIRIDQSILGRVMNYGSISLNSFGGGSELFAQINSPYQFQRLASQGAR